MTSTFQPLWAGNANVSRTVRVDGVTNLSAVSTVTPKVRANDGDTWTTLTGSVLNATDRTITVNYGSWLAALTDRETYQLVVDLTSGSTVETWGPVSLPVLD